MYRAKTQALFNPNSMTLLDIILIFTICAFALFGFWLGFIQAVGSLIGTFLAAFIAGQYFDVLVPWIKPYLRNEGLSHVLAFILLFILVNKAVGLFFWLINKIFHLIAIIPFLKTLNRLLGGLLGFVEGIVSVGIILYIASRYPISETFSAALIDSDIAEWLVDTVERFSFLFPDIINKLQAII